jgi:AcrR family transcriptional regulator
MTDSAISGRPNQKSRTRKDLLQAAARLLKQGRKPSLEEIAAEAMVSRATAYRYFPSMEALLIEAPLDVAVPQAEDLFRRGSPADPVERLERVDTALHDMILANEAPLRMMLANSLQRGVGGDGEGKLPARQNRRTPLIEAALEPARKQFKPADLRTLTRALAIVIGTEAMVVFKDVLQLDDADARKVKRWAIRALVGAARKPGARVS